MARRARVSPDRILDVAALEFAERGFAGARVDRIARRAKVNKAMLYYHFKSKGHLYRTLLRRMFTLAAEHLQAIGASDATPPQKVERAIAGMAAFIGEHAFFPAIMLREVAEGGAHLDRDTLRALASVPGAFGAMVHEGVAAGVFRPVDPVFAYFTMLAPIVFYMAGASIRKEITHLQVIDLHTLSPDDFVRHMQESVRRSFAHDARTRKATTRPTP
jgi:TetR/AcrR family transcriptional regulator